MITSEDCARLLVLERRPVHAAAIGPQPAPRLATGSMGYVRLPGESRLDLQREPAAAKRELPIIFIAGRGDIPMSVRAMKGGRFDRHGLALHAAAGAREPDDLRAANRDYCGASSAWTNA